MKTIKLTKGYETQVSDEDYEWLNQWKWYAYTKKGNNCVYAKRSKWVAKGKSEHLSMHRVIMNVSNSDIKIDHKDGNGLNNQRSNLRIATYSQNNANRNKSKGKYKGVWWCSKNKWLASCTKNRKLYTSYHDTEVEAAVAYNKLAIHHHGEFACVNQLSKEELYVYHQIVTGKKEKLDEKNYQLSIGNKKCGTCNRYVAIKNYPIDVHKPDGRRTQCKDCWNEKHKQRKMKKKMSKEGRETLLQVGKDVEAMKGRLIAAIQKS